MSAGGVAFMKLPFLFWRSIFRQTPSERHW